MYDVLTIDDRCCDRGAGAGQGFLCPPNPIYLAFQSTINPLCDSASSVCVSKSNRELAPGIKLARINRDLRFIRRR